MIQTLFLFLTALRLVNAMQMTSDRDVTVGGLYDVFEPDDGMTCTGLNGKVKISSVMYVEAVRWYLEKLYEQGGLKVKIGMYIYVATNMSMVDHLELTLFHSLSCDQEHITITISHIF